MKGFRSLESDLKKYTNSEIRKRISLVSKYIMIRIREMVNGNKKQKSGNWN